MHIYTNATLTDLHFNLCEEMLFSEWHKFDDVNSVDTQFHNVSAWADSISYDTHIDRVWVAESRWNTLIRQYLDPDNVNEWLDVIENSFPSSKRGIAVLRTNTVKKRRGGKSTTRRWGSCMLSLSFRRRPHPQITLHSRTSYLGYLSLLDLAVPYVCSKLIANRIGIHHEDISFLWSLEMAQFHGCRCLAYPLGDEEVYQKFLDHPAGKKEYPTMFLARKFHDKFSQQDDDGVPYSEMTFSSVRRLRKRWHTQMFGKEYADQFGRDTGKSDFKAYKLLPHTHVDELDFSPIGIYR